MVLAELPVTAVYKFLPAKAAVRNLAVLCNCPALEFRQFFSVLHPEPNTPPSQLIIVLNCLLWELAAMAL